MFSTLYRTFSFGYLKTTHLYIHFLTVHSGLICTKLLNLHTHSTKYTNINLYENSRNKYY
jgi:hypothetical protein